jgi:hypothetical protein
MGQTEAYMSRAEAAAFLRDQGLEYAPTTLQKIVTSGNGPRYALWGNRAVYKKSDLIEWIATKLKPRGSNGGSR